MALVLGGPDKAEGKETVFRKRDGQDQAVAEGILLAAVSTCSGGNDFPVVRVEDPQSWRGLKRRGAKGWRRPSAEFCEGGGHALKEMDDDRLRRGGPRWRYGERKVEIICMG